MSNGRHGEGGHASPRQHFSLNVGEHRPPVFLVFRILTRIGDSAGNFSRPSSLDISLDSIETRQ